MALAARYCQWSTISYVISSSYESSVKITKTVHSLSIVHGDLSCVDLTYVRLLLCLTVWQNNVLLDDKYNARLTDFSYASLVGEALAYLQASTLRPGTVRWAAPEYFSSNPEEVFYCTTKSDIYSFGNVSLQVAFVLLTWNSFSSLLCSVW